VEARGGGRARRGGWCARAEAGSSESRCAGRVAGAQVESGGGGHAGRGGADLSRVREGGAGARGVFLDKAITSVGHH
jgi:hypothetical protein